MNIPNGKTYAQVQNDVNQSDLKANDVGYIDGYVQAADERPYIVFVRISDGYIDLAPFYSVKAIEANYE